MSLSDRERVEGFHRTTMTAVTQTPDDSIGTVYLTPPQLLAVLVAHFVRSCAPHPSRDFILAHESARQRAPGLVFGERDRP